MVKSKSEIKKNLADLERSGELASPEEIMDLYSPEKYGRLLPVWDRRFENVEMGGVAPGRSVLVRPGETVKITGELWDHMYWSWDPCGPGAEVYLMVEDVVRDEDSTNDDGEFELTYRAPMSSYGTYFVWVHAPEMVTLEESSTDKWEVTVQPRTCPEYTTSSECEANNCYWYDGSCHSEEEEEEEEEEKGWFERVEEYVEENPAVAAAGAGIITLMMIRD